MDFTLLKFFSIIEFFFQHTIKPLLQKEIFVTKVLLRAEKRKFQKFFVTNFSEIFVTKVLLRAEKRIQQ